MGRKRLEFDECDRRVVEVLLRHGISAAAVACELDVDIKTLHRHFGPILQAAEARQRFADLERLQRLARAGSARAAIKLDRMSRRGPAPDVQAFIQSIRSSAGQ